MFLLDTKVVSETRRIAKDQGSEQVKQWFAQQSSSQLFVSVITLLEIERGILSLQRRDPVQASHLRDWFESKLKPQFQHRILDINESTAIACAALHTPDPRPEMDALIAATAQVHRFTLVTRNTRDFEVMGVRCVNPWDDAL
jgi:toxin FitB